MKKGYADFLTALAFQVTSRCPRFFDLSEYSLTHLFDSFLHHLRRIRHQPGLGAC